MTDFRTALVDMAPVDGGGQVFNPNNKGFAGGADPTGTSSSQDAFDRCFDDVQTLDPEDRRPIRITPGTYRLQYPIPIYNALDFGGYQMGDGRWNGSSGVRIVWEGADTDDPFVIGGTADSEVSTGGYYIAQGIRAHDLVVVPSSAGGGRNGVLMDGSTTVLATRGPCRDIEISRVMVGDFGQYGITTLGNVFDVRMHSPSVREALGGGFVTVDATSVGVSRAGEIFIYNPNFWSPDDATAWAVDATYTYIYGGGVQGGKGIRFGYQCGLFGTHIERETAPSVSDGSAGILLAGRYGQFFPALVAKFDVGIQIGEEDANPTDYYVGHVAALQGNLTAGVWVTSGGGRAGRFEIGYRTGNGTLIQDDRGLGEFRTNVATLSGGATAARPSSPEDYEQFFDTTLGRPVFYDGAAWADPAAASVLEEQTASNDATIDFTANIDATYGEYVVRFRNVLPAADGASLKMQVSHDGGSTWRTTSGDYDDFGGGSQTAFSISGAVGSLAARGCEGEVRVFNPSDTDMYKRVRSDVTRSDASGVPQHDQLGGLRTSGQAIDGLRFLFDSGNIAAGTFELVGVK